MPQPTYLTTPVKDWPEKQANDPIWKSFYTDLSEEKRCGKPFFQTQTFYNPSSANYICFYCHEYQETDHVYLEIKHKKIWVRMFVKEDAKVNEYIRNTFAQKLKKASAEEDINLRITNTYGTKRIKANNIAIAEIEENSDWIMCKSNGFINFPRTVDFLIKIQKIVHTIIMD